jgi:uncharacterized protein YcbK (DUF882 family)
MKLYFTIEELNPHKYTLTEEQVNNLTILIQRVSIIRERYGKPMVVTSGVRDLAYQMKVNPKAPKSKHLIGAAVDIHDPNGELKAWLKANIKILEEVSLYCEDFDSTPDWVHFQCIAPASGKHVFIP